MFYFFAKMLMTAGLRFFYRHIHVTGLGNIPVKGPVILIANHNSSLMDAALLGILLKRKAYFFARGDVFVNKPIRKILWWLHMMPVHGHQGKRATLDVNNDSFSEGRKILLKGGIIIFFPESTSHTGHQLLPFRKGVFRLAFETATAGHFSVDIPIIPVGITYDDPVACRNSVQVHMGKPLWLSNYTNEYRQNAAAACLHVCKDAQQAVGRLVLHVTDQDRLQMAEQAITISRSHQKTSIHAWKIASAQKLAREQAICAGINNNSDPDFKNRERRLAAYFGLLSAAGITDKTAAGPHSFASWKKIGLWAGFPFYLAGLLLNGLPVLIARKIVDKKVNREDFYSWIFVACYSFIYFIWLMVLFLIAVLAGWPYAVVLLLTMVVTGIIAYVYKDWLHENRQQTTWRALPAKEKNELAAARANVQQEL
ncbi:MAG: 1-acyl-sn-glycerol-3-phosphate acyltransferase [Bacteroidota bacterium]